MGGANGGGYIRSTANTDEQYGLRDDIGKKRGVNTFVQTGEDDLESAGKRSFTSSERKLKGGKEWSSDDETPWEMGIRKTTVHKQTITNI